MFRSTARFLSYNGSLLSFCCRASAVHNIVLLVLILTPSFSSPPSEENTVGMRQGGHKPGKHGKLREYQKLSKSQGKLREISGSAGKNLENSGKM